uniref:Mitochondrial fission process protein 1 n=2 Tax=Entomoneis paludosa TaxID=265537 RepID=A0A6U2XS16_9STRA|mmetsp:Transcript_14121/g.29284  ORF Transcript_14121/g.29284 Transcript_14121/m.29284 type:complete len:322 (+) Transcript_14121:157-1122(+)
MSNENSNSNETKTVAERLWARDWEFGDSHFNTHEFVEEAKVRAPKEIGCAFAASFLVSPLVSIIDKCIVKDIGTTATLMKNMGVAAREMIFQPKQFLTSKPFVLTFAVYFGTYAVANLSELALDVNKIKDDSQRKTLKVSAASVANISLLAWRDAIFARDAAAAGTVKPKTPMRSIGLFAVRDGATMYSTFYVAPKAADFLVEEHGVERNTAELGCALAIPMVTQILTAPIHIHAMDYFNKPTATFAERIDAIKGEFNTVSFARGLRILPAFGIGSFSNNKFRELFIRQTDEEKLLQRRVTRFIETRLTRNNDEKRGRAPA